MPTIQGWEWIIILIVVLLLFGIGRIGRLGSELGKGIRAFREGLREGQDEKPAEEKDKDKVE
jgi:sec-independent protein translocase protein TatA